MIEMKHKTTFFSLISLLIILTFFITSCTTTNNVVSSGIIQNRKYNKGYFVNIFPKRQKVTATQIPKDETIIAATRQSLSKTEKVEDNLIASADDVKQTDNITTKPVIPEEKIVQQKQSNSIVGKIISKIEKKLINPFPKDVPDDKPKVNGMALAGFICGVIALIIILMALASFSVEGGYTLLILFEITCTMLSVILSDFALEQMKKAQTRWKGKLFAIIGLILGLLIVIGFLTLYIYGLYHLL
jgi:hypothetical protein